jgi:hypothetical protein
MPGPGPHPRWSAAWDFGRGKRLEQPDERLVTDIASPAEGRRVKPVIADIAIGAQPQQARGCPSFDGLVRGGPTMAW